MNHEDSFGGLIEAALPGYVVHNLAMPGYGVDQMWMTLRHRGLGLRPQLVIVGLCDADFKRSQAAYRMYEGFNKPTFKLENGRLVPKTPEAQALHYIDNLDAKMEMFERGYLVAKELGRNVYDRVRPLPGRLITPLPEFEVPAPSESEPPADPPAESDTGDRPEPF